MEIQRERQKVDFLALLLNNRGEPCTLEELCNECLLFTVTPAELLKYCEPPDGPLFVNKDGRVFVTHGYRLRDKLLYRKFICREEKVHGATAHLQGPPPLISADTSEPLGTEDLIRGSKATLLQDLTPLITSNALGNLFNEDGKVTSEGSKADATTGTVGMLVGSEGVNIVEDSPGVPGKPPLEQVDGNVTLPLRTVDEKIFNFLPAVDPLQLENKETSLPPAVPLPRETPESSLPTDVPSELKVIENSFPAPPGHCCDASKLVPKLANLENSFPTELIPKLGKIDNSVPEAAPLNHLKPIPKLERIENALPVADADPQINGNIVKKLQFDATLVGKLERTNKSVRPATTAPGRRDAAVLVNELPARECKQKSRDLKVAPRFEDFVVEGEVGSGGYGAVYKVQQKADGRIFAMKCPLEKTHASCVRNEVTMLERLRGADFIIKFERSVNGKLSPKPEGGDKEIDCPSILLEFIEHDRPEVLKKEITIEELRVYCSCLFKALAHMHKKKILHLDVKPDNFLFSRSNKRGCLVDFNLARDESVKRAKRPKQVSLYSGGAEIRNYNVRKSPKRFLLPENILMGVRAEKKQVNDQDSATSKPSERKKPSKRPLAEDLTPIPPEKRLKLMSRMAKKIFGDQNREVRISGVSKDVKSTSNLFPQSMPNSTVGPSPASTTPTDPLKVHETHKDAGNVKRVEQGNRGSHPLFKHAEKLNNQQPPVSSLPAIQTKRLPPLKEKSRLAGLGVPADPRPVAQPSNTKRVKPPLKVKGPCHAVKDGPCVGTKGYRAPEVLMRSPRQTTKVDVWSAGVSMLQLVTGRSPFPSTSTEGALKDIAKLRGLDKIQRLASALGQPQYLLKDLSTVSCPPITVKDWCEKHSRRSDLKGKVPSSLYDLIEKCLEVEPDSRITAEDALRHWFFMGGNEGSDVFKREP